MVSLLIIPSVLLLSLLIIPSSFAVKALRELPCQWRRTRITNFHGERGLDHGHAESDVGASPGDAHSQDALGCREPGPAAATGGL